jgi:hypothetical protein
MLLLELAPGDGATFSLGDAVELGDRTADVGRVWEWAGVPWQAAATRARATVKARLVISC